MLPLGHDLIKLKFLPLPHILTLCLEHYIYSNSPLHSVQFRILFIRFPSIMKSILLLLVLIYSDVESLESFSCGLISFCTTSHNNILCKSAHALTCN